jgi:uncharacterized protein YdaU (DUF1376 family)
MSKNDVWMPFYPGDYLRDTSRLTTEQHGAYFLLIMDYWSNGPAPDDDATLALICRLDTKRWKALRPSIAPFFSVADGLWTHGRIETELAKSVAYREKQLANGKLGGRPKGGQNKPNGKPKNNPAVNPDQNPDETLLHSQPHVPLDEESNGLDPEKVAFDAGVKLLCAEGKSEGQARAIVGKWRKEHGPGQVIEALGAAQRNGVVSIIPWIEARWKATANNGYGLTHSGIPL